MVIAVYGGSFDPPHVGHVLAVNYILSVGVADQVFVVPVFEHAFHKELTTFELRMAMCERAFAHDSRVTVSSIESRLSRPSFTLNTLEALAKEFPGESFRLVIGADVLSDTKNWRRFDRIEQLAPPYVLGRSGIFDPAAPAPVLPEISSSQVRDWCREPSEANQAALERFVPRVVRDMIRDRGIYG